MHVPWRISCSVVFSLYGTTTQGALLDRLGSLGTPSPQPRLTFVACLYFWARGRIRGAGEEEWRRMRTAAEEEEEEVWEVWEEGAG
jgi:hypothetical protein